jgi:MraZ protein
MWLGESTHTLDDKGRLSIPRRLLAGQAADSNGRVAFVVSQGLEGCLFVFTEASFTRASAGLNQQPFAGAATRHLQRRLFGSAEFVELDEKNRVTLPEKLVKFAGLGREVVIVGVGERAEIWPKSRWEGFEREHANDLEQLDSVLSGERPVDSAGA